MISRRTRTSAARRGAVALAIAAGIAGCGSSTKSLASIQKCLNSAGYTATSGSVPSQLAIAVPSKPGQTTFTVTIQPSDSEASSMVSDADTMFGPQGSNTGGGAISQGKVVITHGKAVSGTDLEEVKACAF